MKNILKLLLILVCLSNPVFASDLTPLKDSPTVTANIVTNYEKGLSQYFMDPNINNLKAEDIRDSSVKRAASIVHLVLNRFDIGGVQDLSNIKKVNSTGKLIDTREATDNELNYNVLNFYSIALYDAVQYLAIAEHSILKTALQQNRRSYTKNATADENEHRKLSLMIFHRAIQEKSMKKTITNYTREKNKNYNASMKILDLFVSGYITKDLSNTEATSEDIDDLLDREKARKYFDNASKILKPDTVNYVGTENNLKLTANDIDFNPQAIDEIKAVIDSKSQQPHDANQPSSQDKPNLFVISNGGKINENVSNLTSLYDKFDSVVLLLDFKDTKPGGMGKEISQMISGKVKSITLLNYPGHDASLIIDKLGDLEIPDKKLIFRVQAKESTISRLVFPKKMAEDSRFDFEIKSFEKKSGVAVLENKPAKQQTLKVTLGDIEESKIKLFIDEILETKNDNLIFGFNTANKLFIQKYNGKDKNKIYETSKGVKYEVGYTDSDSYNFKKQ